MSVNAVHTAQLLLKVGDGADPEVFASPVLINMDRSVSMTTNFSEVEIPHPTSQTTPGSILRFVRSVDYTISGAGKLHEDDLADYLAWIKSGASKNIRAEIGGTSNGGQFIAGAFYLETFELTGPHKEVVEVSISLRPVDTGAVTTGALS